jgi:hypothetical protein
MGFSNRCRGGVGFGSDAGADRQSQTKAEIIIHTEIPSFAALPSFGQVTDPALLLVVWTLKREVRATGGCLGMYRR